MVKKILVSGEEGRKKGTGYPDIEADSSRMCEAETEADEIGCLSLSLHSGKLLLLSFSCIFF